VTKRYKKPVILFIPIPARAAKSRVRRPPPPRWRQNAVCFW
jgi:hypothetical protein